MQVVKLSSFMRYGFKGVKSNHMYLNNYII